VLVLVDEFARTTGPREGRALLVALVEALARRGALGLVTTHFDGVARDAGVTHLAIAGLGQRSLDGHAARDIHAALDAVAAAMDYRIIAVAGEAHAHSDALALAGLLGLDETIVARARDLYARPDHSRESPNSAEMEASAALRLEGRR
jgi:DNA mismatch repair ATPase MutS